MHCSLVLVITCTDKALFETNSITVVKSNAGAHSQEPFSGGQVSGYITT